MKLLIYKLLRISILIPFLSGLIEHGIQKPTYSLVLENGYSDQIQDATTFNQQTLSQKDFSLIRLAILRRDITTVKNLLAAGYDPNTRNEYKWTPLMYTIREGHEEIARLLLDNGADVNAKDENGTSALILAALMEHEKIVELLLNKGADIQAKDNYGQNTLFKAVARTNLNVVRTLIKKGVSIDDIDNQKVTALMRSRFDVITEALLDAGASINLADQYGNTALMYALYERDIKKAQVLLNRSADFSLRNKKGQTALRIAVITHFQEAIDMLKHAGAKQ